MNGNEVLRIVDSIHRDKSIDKEIVFEGVEQAILSAARKHFGEEELIDVRIDRASGQPQVTTNGREIDRDELGDILGRISAQTAKQVMIQKIREAERDTLFDEFAQMRSQIVSGTITRNEGSAITVNIGKAEAILPRSEMIPGESHRPNERVRAVILEVKKMGPRVRVVLSRAHPDFVRRLLELEIPEVSERIIEIRSLAREAGYRTKVAVSCIDSNIDPVGACVGVRGARIRNVGEELGGERIEVVRWNDSLQVLVPNAMQPAEVEDVILCPMLGRVLVLVRDDQLSLAIGKRGQNVRLASKLVGWDIDVMTREELDQQLDLAVVAYSQIPGVTEELAEGLVSQGFLSFEDLSVIEPDQLMEMGSLTQEQADVIVEYAEKESERIEKEQDVRRATEKAERQSQEREQRRLDELARLAGPKSVAVVAEEAVEAPEVSEASKSETVATIKVEAEGTAGN